MNRNCPKEYFIILYREFWRKKTAYRYQVIQVVTLSSPIIGGHDSPFKRSHLTIPKGWLVDYLLTALASCWASRVRRFGAPICKHQGCFAFMSDVRSGSCGAGKLPVKDAASFKVLLFFWCQRAMPTSRHALTALSSQLHRRHVGGPWIDRRKSSKELLKQPSWHRRGRIWDPVAVTLLLPSASTRGIYTSYAGPCLRLKTIRDMKMFSEHVKWSDMVDPISMNGAHHAHPNGMPHMAGRTSCHKDRDKCKMISA